MALVPSHLLVPRMVDLFQIVVGLLDLTAGRPWLQAKQLVEVLGSLQVRIDSTCHLGVCLAKCRCKFGCLGHLVNLGLGLLFPPKQVSFDTSSLLRPLLSFLGDFLVGLAQLLKHLFSSPM